MFQKRYSLYQEKRGSQGSLGGGVVEGLSRRKGDRVEYKEHNMPRI